MTLGGVCRTDSIRFVNQYELSVKSDLVILYVDLNSLFRNCCAVDAHPSGGDQFFALAAGGDARVGQVLLKAHGLLAHIFLLCK